MRRWPLAALLLAAMLALPAAQAQITLVDARIEAFRDLHFTAADEQTLCEGDSGFEILPGGTGFRFYEIDEVAAAAPGEDPGYLATGCGTLTKRLPVPPGLDRVVVRFEADRLAETYRQELQAEAPLEQRVQILDARGNPVHEHHVFPGTEESQSMQPIEFIVDDEVYGESLAIRWVFRDEGLAVQGGQQNPLSGQAFGGTVQNVVVQFSIRVPEAETDVSSERSRQGTLLTTEHRIAIEVPEGFDAASAPAVSVRVAAGTGFYGIITPDGTLLRDVSTHDSEDVLGYDQTQSTLQITGSYTQVTFPRILVDAHGPGLYTFVFRDSGGVQVSPTLVPLAGVLLVAPLPFATLAWIESRAFRKEAFGRYAASARNLQWGVAMVFAYYAVVVSSAAAGGRLALMAVWPMPLEGWLLHAQVLLAGVAFTVLWLVARELFLIVRPPRAPPEA